ncbi:hypothetical protein [Nostoc sp. DedQUE09]|uniref:hypothetical protein n=1 Tax=Nostoc sp. DedQUE09 TaxID=3075394 RepID=UPI002AD2CB65|nr:hypothetical protein [Nostoc sp. DedQUE09]MDZ7955588.1 hypothetical protein [Nostoc sp. DedQUE09]
MTQYSDRPFGVVVTWPFGAFFHVLLGSYRFWALLNRGMNQAIASSLPAHSADSATEPYLR